MIHTFPIRHRPWVFAPGHAVLLLSRPTGFTRPVTADLAEILGPARADRHGLRFWLKPLTGGRRNISAAQLVHAGACDCQGRPTPAILRSGQVVCPTCHTPATIPAPDALRPEPTDAVARFFAVALMHGWRTGVAWGEALDHARCVAAPPAPAWETAA